MTPRKPRQPFFNKERAVASRENAINTFEEKQDASIHQDYSTSRKFLLFELGENLKKIEKILKSRYASELNSDQRHFLEELKKNTLEALNSMNVMDFPYVQSLPHFKPLSTEKWIIRIAETYFPIALQKILERIEKEEEKPSEAVAKTTSLAPEKEKEEEEKSREKTGPRI